MLIPACMSQISQGQFKCSKYGFIIYTNSDKIQCFICNMPTITQMAENFGKALVNYAKDGFTNVNDEEFERRIQICNSNECGEYNSGRCNLCGCYLTLKAKWASQSCPSPIKDYWGVPQNSGVSV